MLFIVEWLFKIKMTALSFSTFGHKLRLLFHTIRKVFIKQYLYPSFCLHFACPHFSFTMSQWLVQVTTSVSDTSEYVGKLDMDMDILDTSEYVWEAGFLGVCCYIALQHY